MKHDQTSERTTPYRWVAAIALLGLLLSGTTYYFSQQHEDARIQADFEHLTHDRALRFQNGIDQSLEVLSLVQGLFDATQQVTRSEFRLMVSPALQRHPEIMAINWAPRVRLGQRKDFEHQLLAEGLGKLGFFDVTPDAGGAQRAGRRAEYFPVIYSEPLTQNRSAIGIDPYARPENREAMDMAVRQGRQWSTKPFNLVQDQKGPKAVAIYQPVFRHGMPATTPDERQAALRGFVILVIRPAISLESALSRLSPVGIDTELHDPEIIPTLIHHHSGRYQNHQILPGGNLRSEYPLTLPGRKWILKMAATEGFRDRSGSREPTTVLVSSLFLSGLLCLLLLAHARQTVQQKATEYALKESETRFQQLADNLDAVFWINTPDWHQIIYISPAYERIWGRSAENLYQRSMDWFEAILEEDQPAVKQHIQRAVESDWQSIEFPPYRIRRPDGEIRWISARAFPIRDDKGRIHRVAGIAEDISERQSQQQHLEDLAHFDPLTHLPNRRLLADRLQLVLAQCHRTGQMLGVCMLDLDGFKPVNDKYGHEVGDQLLIEVAHRLQESVRGGDTVARLGGDEFVLLLGQLTNGKELEDALRRLLHILALPYSIGNESIIVSASIGVTLHPNDRGDADTLLRHADHAMYLAKEAGKNRYQQFNPVLEERERDNRTALSLIKKAVTENQFRLFYQPIVDCRRGLVVGMEALVRWEHPILGLMGPAEFLPLVEGDDTLARSVGSWVMRNALQQAEDWRQAGLDIPVSINVFVQQLRDAEFPEQLSQMLAEHPDLPPNRVCIEILESSALDDFASVIRLIRACSGQGVRFALDDFGTGFSSLTYLRQLPVNTLKIDQSFVRDMLQDPEDLTIVEGVIGLSTAFHRQVIAEGVESTDHALMLMEIGCYQVQGYGIAKPMPGEESEAWIKAFKPDPRWLENNAQRLSRDDFQLVLAEVNHRQWLASLQNWMRIDADHRGSAPQLDGHACNFGHWYYGEGENRYGHLPDFRAAETLHDRIHRLAQQLVRRTERGDISASRDSEAELMDAADAFRDILARIRTTVKHADAGQ